MSASRAPTETVSEIGRIGVNSVYVTVFDMYVFFQNLHSNRYGNVTTRFERTEKVVCLQYAVEVSEHT